MRNQSLQQGMVRHVRRGVAVFRIGPRCLVWFALLLQAWSAALAAPAFVQEKDNQVTSGTSSRVTLSSPAAAGNLIAVYLIWDNTGGASVSDSLGNAYVSAVGPTRWSNGNYSAQIFYAINARGGSETVTATFAAKITSGIVYAHEYSGVNPTAALDVTAAAAGTSGSLSSGSATTTNATDLLFGGGVSANMVMSPGAGYTARSRAEGNITEDRVVSALGSYSATASNSGGAWAMQMVAFRGAASTIPTGLTALAASPSSINLSWTAPSITGQTNYVLQRCQGAGCASFVQIATPAGTSYTDTGLAANTSYSYRVAAAYSSSGLSPYSNVVSATTQPLPPPAAPTKLAAVAASPSSINLSWTASTGPGLTNYVVQRCRGAFCGNFMQIATPVGITYSDTRLTANTSYSYRVQAANSSGKLSSYSNVASATTLAQPPTAPGNLTATAASTTQINLSWTASSSSIGLANYVVQRCLTSSCTFVTIATPTSTTYTDTALTPYTGYSYQVQAVDTAKNSSSYSNMASATTLAQPPTAPGNLTATAASTTQINLSWTASTSTVGLANYVVQRCLTSSCTFVTIATPTSTTYADTALTPNTGYSYQVQAIDTAKNSSAFSNMASATTLAQPPTAPGNLTATAASTTQINLSWTASTSTVGLANYVVQRCLTSSCTFVTIATPTSTTYADTALTPNTGYSYQVQAIDTAKNSSAFSNVASATTLAQPPTAPGNLTATAASTTQINLSWTASTSTVGVANYVVQRCLTSSCAFVTIATPTSTTYADTALTPNTGYSYQVQAVDTAKNSSSFSNLASATTLAQPPTAPGNLTATAASTTQINLSWSASSSSIGLANYVVQRCQGTGCSNFVQIAAPTSTAYSDTELLANTSYSYQIAAADTAGNLSPFSGMASAVTQAPPTAPGSLSAVVASTTQINLSWTASTSTVGLANYVLQRCQGAGCSNFVAVASPAGTTYSDTGLPSTTSFSYQVQAIDTAGNASAFSGPASATTTVLRPYSTSFPLTENPISEAGNWINGLTNGLDWGDVQTTPGLAFGTNAGNDADSTGILSGSWGPDQTVQATVHSVNQNDGLTEEVELRLRSTLSAHSNTGYEISFRCSKTDNAYSKIVLWNGALGNLTPLWQETGSQYGVANGDVVEATVAGNVITAYINGVQVAQVTDSTFAAGNPGLGFYLDGGSGVNADYGFTSFTASDGTTSTAIAVPLTLTAPGNLTATAISTSQINLSWSASSSSVGLANYVVERCQGVGCSNFAQIAAPTGTSYTDTGLLPGTVYSYEVQAVDTAGNLSPFSTASAITQAPPTAPGNLTATAASTTQINLSWTASSSSIGLANYVVQRCLTSSCTFVTIATPTSTTYADTALTPNTGYSYQVQAVDTAKNSSSFSNVASATTLAQPPTAPGNLTATAASTTQINLSWSASSSSIGVANYVVQRCLTSSCTFVTIATPTSTTYADTALTPNTGYSYQVQAVDTAKNSSSFSNVASATTLAQPPTAPGNLTATAASTTQINLSWTASTSTLGLAYYVIQRCLASSCTLAQIASVNATAYTDSGLSPGTSYTYEVEAVDTAGNVGPLSSAASATTMSPQPPTAPGSLTATAAGATQINLSWTASTSVVGLANYVVQRCQGASCTNFAQIGAPAGTTYTDTGLSSNTSYSYRVQAVDTAGNSSPFSSIASATTASSPYSTNFPLTENPISENGHWINGGTVGLDWANVQTVAGTAEGVGPASVPYSDPTAILAGTWGPNQTVTATVYSNGVEDKPTQGYDKEVEIRLRTSISAHVITGYEVNCRTPNDSYSYIQIVRWNGALGDFTSLNIMYGTGCANGDILMATISGSTINVYRNGTLMLTATDSTYTSGNPGMGFNFGCGTAYNEFGFTSYSATDGTGTGSSPPAN